MARVLSCCVALCGVTIADGPAFNPFAEAFPVFASSRWMVWNPWIGLRGDALLAYAKEPYLVLQDRGEGTRVRIPLPAKAGADPSTAVLADGTLLLRWEGGVAYARAAAPARTEPSRIRGKEAILVHAWPDGALFRVPSEHRDRKDASWFVPLRADTLDYGAAVPLQAEGHSGAFAGPVVRHGDLVCGTDFAFDLKKQALVPLGATLKEVVAFDGVHAVGEARIAELGGEGTSDLPQGHRVLVARHGRGYAVVRTGERLALRAVDLAAPGMEPRTLCDVAWPAQEVRVARGPGVAAAAGGKGIGFSVLWDDEGLLVWQGGEWVRHAWIR